MLLLYWDKCHLSPFMFSFKDSKVAFTDITSNNGTHWDGNSLTLFEGYNNATFWLSTGAYAITYNHFDFCWTIHVSIILMEK